MIKFDILNLRKSFPPDSHHLLHYDGYLTLDWTWWESRLGNAWRVGAEFTNGSRQWKASLYHSYTHSNSAAVVVLLVCTFSYNKVSSLLFYTMGILNSPSFRDPIFPMLLFHQVRSHLPYTKLLFRLGNVTLCIQISYASYCGYILRAHHRGTTVHSIFIQLGKLSRLKIHGLNVAQMIAHPPEINFPSCLLNFRLFLPFIPPPWWNWFIDSDGNSKLGKSTENPRE